MQFIGTELFRNNTHKVMPKIGEDIWLKVLEKKILDNPNSKYVITDIRFENELEMIARLDGLKIKVERDNLTNLDTHISESLIDSLNTEFTIKNNGSREELIEKIDDLLNNLQYKKINNFYNVDVITKDTLYVFDIDDTLITYDNINNDWWRKTYDLYKTPASKQHDVINLVLVEWEKQLINSIPKHSHEESLGNLIFNMLNKNNNFICLTARKEKYKEITENHLKQLGLHTQVHYTNGDCKGKMLKEIIKDHSNIKNIVFIDDQLKNLYSVHKEMKNCGISVDCYHFRQ